MEIILFLYKNRQTEYWKLHFSACIVIQVLRLGMNLEGILSLNNMQAIHPFGGASVNIRRKQFIDLFFCFSFCNKKTVTVCAPFFLIHNTVMLISCFRISLPWNRLFMTPVIPIGISDKTAFHRLADRKTSPWSFPVMSGYPYWNRGLLSFSSLPQLCLSAPMI